MTDVHFHHNAVDLAGTACHLATRAFNAGRRVTVLVPDADMARQIDQMLWTRQPMSFLPHVGIDAPLAADTPITLATAPPEGGWLHDDVLINLAPSLPPAFDHFKMLVEVVGTDDAQRVPARERWRHYAAHGLKPVPHNTQNG